MSPRGNAISVNQYVIPPSLDDWKCIGPTSTGKRCASDIGRASALNAERLRRSLKGLGGTARREIIWIIIYLHVCPNTHRRNLRSRENDWKDILVDKYEAAILQACVEDYNLRHDILFFHYVPPAKPDIKAVLLSSVNTKQYHSGFVYAFCWPVERGYIKIGYAKDSVDKRIKKWEDCFPELELIPLQDKSKVPWPERMEKLIHLELNAQRCSMYCQLCNADHIEWFKMTAQHASRIIETWTVISTAGQLYGQDGRLSRSWKTIIESCSNITADTLFNYWQNERAIATRAPHDLTERLQSIEPELCIASNDRKAKTEAKSIGQSTNGFDVEETAKLMENVLQISSS